ncbi:hypothetical protein K466DRAFT_563161 [Polyporus arcularius HHB13444]|uniref:Protein kinase domain-containing protein n=1 Tax=Polyporus arcularius HHB13444 TaxID=1314778 RepID=A0A5C3PRQ7_9APHY|nr:hypothetical protein K466DRAFT_563161 [Polyporus arcularius HHB13444]
MDRTLRALRISEKIADGIPVPGLKSAINVALSIAEMADEAKNARERCGQLAERAAMFTLAVYDHLRRSDATIGSVEMTEHVANFLCALEDIEAYMRRQGRKSLFSVMRSSGRIDEDIARLNTTLEDAVRLFNMQNSLCANAQLSLISDAQSRLLTHADDVDRVGALLLSRTRIVEAGVTELVRRDVTVDGTLKLFGREDIDLLEELEPEVPWPDADETRVMRYRAELRQSGSIVVIRRFPRNDDRFRRAVEVSKRIWHPYIVQTLGVSRPDPHQAFIVQDGTGMNGAKLLVHLRKLRGLDKLNYVIECMKQLNASLSHLCVGWVGMLMRPQSAFDYMKDNGMNWPSQEDDMHNIFPQDLVLLPNGKLQWDLNNWAMSVLPCFIDLPKLVS